MKGKRQLAAIMYCDIAGFSSIMHTNPSLAEEIRTRHQEVFKNMHTQYHGTMMQHLGDCTMSIFPSAADAVECAYHIQLELRKSPEIPVRIGIHTGEIVHDEHGVYGEGINLARKIEQHSHPGSILVSDKVYDDIRTHPWLVAKSIGKQTFQDHIRRTELYSIVNRGIKGMETETYQQPTWQATQLDKKAAYPPAPLESIPQDGKKKKTAGFLALFMAFLGVHRIYLDQRGRAFINGGITFILLMVSLEERALPLLFIYILTINLVEAILFFVMPHSEFHERYNLGIRRKNRIVRKKSPRLSRRKRKRMRKEGFKLMKEAMKAFEADKFETAVNLFDELLVIHHGNADAHYYLACCFSMLHDIDDAFFHLEKSVELGLNDLEKIERNAHLRNLRSHIRYRAFCHTYLHKEVAPLPPPSTTIFDDPPHPTVLDQLELLGNKLKSGELSTEEFEAQKIKLLGR